MNINKIIQSKIKRLAWIFENDGVKPSEIVDNLFLNSYESMVVKRVGESLISEVVFHEELEPGKKIKTKLVYSYSLDKKLMRIEEVRGRKRIIEWDREIITNEIINDIIDCIKLYYSDKDMNEFINSLPLDISYLIKKKVNVA